MAKELTFSCTPINEAISAAQAFQPHLSSVGVCETDTLVSEVADNTKDNIASVRSILALLSERVAKHLELGERVTIKGLCRFEPTPDGSLPSEDAPWDPKKNSIRVACIPYDNIKSAAADLVPVNTLKQVDVRLLGAQDATTFEQNCVVKGHTLLCQGVGMAGRYQENDDEGLFVINSDGVEKKLTITDSTRVTVDATVPDAVEPGVYKLELRSRDGFSKSRTLIKSSIAEFTIKAA